MYAYMNQIYVGTWTEGSNRQLYPVSGIAYMTSPPADLAAALRDPFQVVFYVGFVLSACR